MNKYEHLLPPEFKSGNDIPVTRAIISRERMMEIIRSVSGDRDKLGQHEKLSKLELLEAVNSWTDEDWVTLLAFSPKSLIDRLKRILHSFFETQECQCPNDAKMVPLFPTDEIVRELKQQFGIEDDYGIMMWYTDFISRVAIGD